jgi:hypothetical protein
MKVPARGKSNRLDTHVTQAGDLQQFCSSATLTR